MAALRLREATQDDCHWYFELVNDPVVRRASVSSAPIPWQSHERWFAGQLADADAWLYVLEVDGVPAAQIRFNREDAVCWIDYSVAPTHRGAGLGEQALRLGAAALTAAVPGAIIRGAVKAENRASVRSFEKAGYARVDDHAHPGMVVFQAN